MVSGDRQWLAGPLVDPQRPGLYQLELTSLMSGERRLVEVPFRLAWGHEPRFTPDGRSIVVLGWPSVDTTGRRLFVVPVNGGRPRALTTVNSPAALGLSFSPDGASVAYTAQENQTTSLLLIDLRPALSRASTASSKP